MLELLTLEAEMSHFVVADFFSLRFSVDSSI